VSGGFFELFAESATLTITRSVTGVNRLVAWALALVWLSGGTAALVFGLAHGRLPLAIIGAFALWYAILWFRVVAHSRLLSWSELVAPWRPRKARS
jgi:hypothetical protein